jgi:uncharacterized iron-regulated protein
VPLITHRLSLHLSLSLLILLASNCAVVRGAESAGAESAGAESSPLQFDVLDRGGHRLSFGQLMDQLNTCDFVCIGESHDSKFDHDVQLQIVKALYARDESFAVGLEIFQRPFQPVLDKFLKGEIDEPQMLKETGYQQRWGYDSSLYHRLISFCQRNSIPIAALNAPKELTSRISKVGIAGLSDDERTQLGEIDLSNEQHRKHWFDTLSNIHGHPNTDKAQKERSYQVMVVWDDYMAKTAADFKRTRGVRHMVILAGSGHIDFPFGIPDRVARYANATRATVSIRQSDDRKSAANLTTDFVIVKAQ